VRTIWLGIDDTDSPRGGCTTWVLTELLREARSAGVDVIGAPRLVRLNPNVPWKTRGNAALAARFGEGRGPRRRIGEIDGAPVWSFASGRPLAADAAVRWPERAWRRVRTVARTGEPGTDPALVAVERPLPPSLYWNAVRDVVTVASVRRTLAAAGAFVRTSGSARGVVGASAAIAWPGRRATWELISYRAPERWGTAREVDGASVRGVGARFPRLFLCEDRRTRRILVAPHTPCPILFGLRGTARDAPLRARRGVRSEPVDRWVLFRTNQGTGDHLAPWPAAELSRYRSGWVAGEVAGAPTVLAGGHVRLPVVDASGRVVPCVAFEPTKTLPAVCRTLRPGDRVRVWGSRGTEPALRLEGITLLGLVPRSGAVRPPRCGACSRATRSLGRQRGYRCPGCHRRWPPEAAVAVRSPAVFGRGTYHPTPSARRHLALLGPER
jgi:tRNA(Ile2)-agmatinylcytidine synthase